MLTLNQGDIIILRPLNNPGFVCGQGKIVYFYKQEDDYLLCALDSDPKSKAIIKIKLYQISEIVDFITGMVKYTHDPAEAV